MVSFQCHIVGRRHQKVVDLIPTAAKLLASKVGEPQQSSEPSGDLF